MARLTDKTSFRSEDYQDAPEWFGKFIASLNGFMETIYNAFQKNIDTDNLTATFRDVIIQTKAAAPMSPYYIENPLGTIPKMVLLAKCQKISSTHTAPTTALYLDWILEGTKIKIVVVGLDTNSKYSVSLYIM